MTTLELIKFFFSVNLKDYENLKLDFEINKFILVAFVGVLFAIIISSIYRSSVYLLTNRLLRKEVWSEDNAMTLSELGIDFFRIRYVISGNSRLRDIVKMVGEVKPTYEEYVAEMKTKKKDSDKIDFKEARFYISPENWDKAKEIVLKSNTSVLNIVLFCILLFILTVTLVILMPEILGWLNGILAKK